jgi:DNA-directed RNA polymerase specialized sigma24 family protein
VSLFVDLQVKHDAGRLTQPEVARLTALPEGRVKVRLHRARLRLCVALGTA